MDIVKKNWLSILFGVIAIAAIGVNFLYVSGKFDDLHKQASARAAVNSTINGLLPQNKERHLPVLTIDAADHPQKLDMFPTDAVIKAAEEKTTAVTAGAKALVDQAVRINKHEPLVEGALPAGEPLRQLDFARRYTEEMNVASLDAEGRKRSIAGRILHAGMVPGQTELEQAKLAKAEEIRKNELAIVNGQAVNQQQVDQDIAQAIQALPDELRKQVADSSMIYINSSPQGQGTQSGTFTIFPGNPPITIGTPPDHEKIFWAQVQLWVQQDLCKALYDINSKPYNGTKAANVAEAPIKQLVRVTVPVGFLGMTNAQSIGQPMTTDPNAAAAAGGGLPAEPTPNTALTPSGRTSNGLYDVVQYSVEMDVEADKLPQVLEDLGRGRLITVLQVQAVTCVYSALYKTLGYYYGTKPVVKVQLQLEQLFMRDWTRPLMPQIVKQRLGVQDQPAAGTPPPA